MEKINVAIVGAGFGEVFLNIYRSHPNVGEVTLCDVDEAALQTCANKHPGVKTYLSFEKMLEDKSIDAVHLMTPIPIHAEQTVAVLESGKHCACTVPMATTLDGIKRICETVRKTGKNYMLMETSLYTYHMFYVKRMIESGELGRIQFMRGTHFQDMSRWGDYWMGLPPMHYGSHAIGPMVALSGSRIKRVNCFGAGTMEEWRTKKYGNPFPIECALFEFENGLKGEATRSLFETARVYQEGMNVYGSKKSFEWGFGEDDDPYVTTLADPSTPKGDETAWANVVTLPNFHHNLPKEIQRFTVGDDYGLDDVIENIEIGKGGGHHGSHPHLVHEFIMSILENRKPYIDEIMGGNITAAGICAHESAMRNGEAVTVPEF